MENKKTYFVHSYASGLDYPARGKKSAINLADSKKTKFTANTFIVLEMDAGANRNTAKVVYSTNDAYADGEPGSSQYIIQNLTSGVEYAVNSKERGIEIIDRRKRLYPKNHYSLKKDGISIYNK